jgi:hypothetical protein
MASKAFFGPGSVNAPAGTAATSGDVGDVLMPPGLGRMVENTVKLELAKGTATAYQVRVLGRPNPDVAWLTLYDTPANTEGVFYIALADQMKVQVLSNNGVLAYCGLSWTPA